MTSIALMYLQSTSSDKQNTCLTAIVSSKTLQHTNVHYPYSPMKYTGELSAPLLFLSHPVSVKCFSHFRTVYWRRPKSNYISRRVM